MSSLIQKAISYYNDIQTPHLPTLALIVVFLALS